MALVSVLLFTVFKMHLVIRHFMMVRHAPVVIRYLCTTWLVLLFALLLWVYR